MNRHSGKGKHNVGNVSGIPHHWFSAASIFAFYITQIYTHISCGQKLFLAGGVGGRDWGLGLGLGLGV